MPVGLSELIESLQTSLSTVPAALAAIVFLAGPTVAWIVYRVVVLPRNNRYADQADGLLWMCVQCRSANEVREARCYRCGLERTTIEGDLHIVDGDEIVTLASEAQPTYVPGPSAPVPVMAAADDPVMNRPDGVLIAAGAASASALASMPPEPALPPTPTVVPPVTPRRLVVVPGKAAVAGDRPMVPVGPGATVTATAARAKASKGTPAAPKTTEPSAAPASTRTRPAS